MAYQERTDSVTPRPRQTPVQDLPPTRTDGFSDTAMPPVTKANTGMGQIVFRVTTARGAIPLEGVQITVRPHQPDPSTNDRGKTTAVLYSDRDGKTEPLPLPAPPRSDSLAPTDSGVLPFATYDAEIYFPGYYAPEYTRIPIFDGITSIQSVDLIPLPENGREEQLSPSDTQFFEGENPDL